MIPDILRGKYYAAAKTTVQRQLDQAFESKRGPGAKPLRESNGSDIKAIIAPSYSYSVAAPCAAWSYNALAEAGRKDVYIILSQGDALATTEETHVTPYGYARVNQALARDLVEKTPIQRNDEVFQDEELIKSQLPLLQYTFRQEHEKLKILPIMLDGSVDLKTLAVDLKEVLMDNDVSYHVIVPTNLTKYGSAYDFVPFTQDRIKQIEELDAKTLKHISNQDQRGLLDHVSETLLTTDNYLGIVLAQLLTKPDSVEVQQYYTTHDFDEDRTRIVSFAAITMR